MTKYVTQKNKNILILFLVAIIGAGMSIWWQGALRPLFAYAQSLDQISLSLSLYDAKNEAVNGTFDIRFAIYTADRTNASASETAGKIWEETKQVDVRGGMIVTQLGDSVAIPQDLFSDPSKSYYLGIKIDQDSEMIPRKKIAAVPSALDAANAQTLGGKVVGTAAGDIPVLGSGNKFDLNLLPTGSGTNQLVLGNDGRLHSQNTDTGTSQNTFILGSGTGLGGTNFDLSVSSASTKPTLRYDASANEWTLSNDGSVFNPILTAGAPDSLVAPSRGGTGLSSYEQGDMLYAQDATTIAALSRGTDGQVLVLSGGLPAWSSSIGGNWSGSTIDVAHGGTGNTAFTAGSVIFSDGTKLTEDHTRFFWDAATQRLGLGTTTPAALLSVGISSPFQVDGSGNVNATTLTLSTALPVGSGGTGLSSNPAGGFFLIGNGTGYTSAPLTQGTGITIAYGGAGLVTVTNAGVTTLSGTTDQVLINGGTSLLTGPITLSLPQSIATNSAPTFASLSTGHGQNELYAMDQDVLTASSPTFANLTISNTLTLTNPLTAGNGGTGLKAYSAGDMLYYASGNTLSKLPIGAPGQVLVINGSNIPGWVNSATSTAHGLLSSSHSDTYATPTLLRGDIITAQGGDNGNPILWNRLGLGTTGQVLISNGTDVYWGAVSGQNGIIAANSIDFSELKNALTLDANLTIASTVNHYSINIDSNTFFVDTANHRVGLGTNTPATALDLGTGVITTTGGTSTNWNTASAKRVDTWNSPLSFSGNTASLLYNATNLKIDSDTNTLNTIQDVATTSAPTFATLNTGQGAYELYAMNQDVLTTSNPTFSHLALTYALPVSSGGTGIASYAIGDLLYASGTTAISKLAHGSDGQVLVLSGGLPVWSTAVSGSWGGSTIDVAHGGTGATSFTSNYLLRGNATSAVSSSSLVYDNGTNVGIGTATPYGKLNVYGAPTASANYGTLSIGGGAFDGATSGKFVGSASGTSLAVNEASAYTGNLMDLQVGGNSKFKIENNGVVTVAAGLNLSGFVNAASWTARFANVVTGWGAPSTTGAFSWVATVTDTGNQVGLKLAPTYNQTSGTASNTDLLINRTQTAVGSGAQSLANLQVGGTSWYSFATGNTATTGGFNAASGTENAVTIAPIINQSGTAGWTGLLVNPTLTAVGSGSQVSAAFMGGKVGIGTTNPSTYTLQVVGTGGFGTSTNSPIFQGQAAAVTFGNASYASTIAGSALTISPTAWTATPTISGLITATSGITSNGAFTLGANQNLVMTSGTGTFAQIYTGIASASTIAANNLTTGSILSLTSASTAAGANNTGLNIAISGANATAGITRYGFQSAVTATGTTNTNVAGYFSATGATNNYGLIVASGNVGIGTTSPSARLHILQSGTPASTATSYGALIENQVINGSADGFRKYGLFVSSTGNWAGDGADNYGLYVDVPMGGSTNTIAAFAGSSGNISMPGTGYELQFSRPGINYLTASNAAGSLVLRTGGINNRLSIDSSGNFNVNAGQLYVQQSTGSIGIGTTSPATSLEIEKIVSGTGLVGGLRLDSQSLTTGDGLSIDFMNTNDNASIGSRIGSIRSADGGGSANLVFYTKPSASGAMERMRIDSTGNVGIGTTGPGYQLDVQGSSALASMTRFNDTGATYPPGFLFTRARGTQAVPADIVAGDWLGKTQFRGRIGGTVSDYGAFAFIASDTSQNGRFSFLDRDLTTERMVILNSGNVGIGTTSPTALLSVGATSQFQVNTSGNVTAGTYNGNTITSGTGTLTLGSYALALSASSNINQNLLTTSAPTFAGLTLNGTLVQSASTSGYLSSMTNTDTTTGGGLFVQTNGTGNILDLNVNGSDIVTISEAASTFNNPTSFMAVGDVSMAYDLLLTNATSSTIKSAGPVAIEAGETFNSSTLTLRTFNAGQIVLDSPGGVSLLQSQAWTVATGTSALNIINASASSLFNIDSTNSRIGIGTTGPRAKLDIVNGSANTNGDAAQDVEITGPKTNIDIYQTNLAIQTNDAQGTGIGGSIAFGGLYRAANDGANFAMIKGAKENSINANTEGYLAFFTRSGSGNERMRITSTGNVGIGTTSPSYTLQVNGTAWVTSGAWSGSDQRWKKNIQPIANSLDKVLQLSGVSYDWRADEFPANNFDNKTHLGFIAQDVEKIVPDLVTTGADGFKGIDYSGFSSLLVNAVKEQQTQVTSLAANLDTLTLKTDQGVTTLSGLQTSVDANLLTISGTLATLDTRLSSIDDTKTGKLTTLDSRILSLEKTVGLSASALSHETRIADLESQMTTLKDENLALMDFFTTFKSGGIVTKDKDNNVDLLGGKLTATIVETGALVIDVIDPDAATAGVDSIMPVATDPGSDGKSVFIKTTAVTSDSRIYVTPIGSTKNQVPFIDSVKDGKGFTVSVDDPVLVDLRFNWLIVGKR